MSYNPHRKEIMNTSDKEKALDWTPLRHEQKDQIHGNQDSLAEHSQNYFFFFSPGFLIMSLGFSLSGFIF